MRKLLGLLCCFFMLVACSTESSLPEPTSISVVLKSNILLNYGDLGDPTLEFSVTPIEVLAQPELKVQLLDRMGSVSTRFELQDLSLGSDGICKAIVHCKDQKTEDETLHLAVSSRGLTGYSIDFRLKFQQMRVEQLSLDGNPATIDIQNQVLKFTFPAVFDFSHLKITYKLSGGSLFQNGKEILSNQFIDLTQNRSLTLTEGNSQKEYQVEFVSTGLPVVQITTPNNASITSKEVWMEGADLKIYLGNRTESFSGATSIRGRGNSTWWYNKKPYALKLEKKSEILGMPKHKRWVLLAQWKDRTLLRNDAAFWLSRQTGLDYTVRGQFVDVILNGKFLGNYYLCEQIKVDKNRVNVIEMDAGEDDPEKITGGYLLELDTYYDEVNKFRSVYYNLPYMFKEPDEETLSEAGFSYLKNYVDELEAILKDEERVKNHEYEKLLDVDSTIDWFFVHELATNDEPYSYWPEVGPHSCYMHKDRGGKLIFGPVWDFDYHGFTPDRAQRWVCDNALYYKALVKDEKYRERMLERWELLKPKFVGLLAYLDQQVQYIRLSEEVNHKLWPIVNNSDNGDESLSHENAVERMKKAFQTKLEWMSYNLKNLK